ncbi:hypothetical protein IHE44_0014882 [Lamprotornis superbus]|uniref:Uncharacterized protein n=1 Tax=Lamprotornis superbus TaxID=245042 RepID=A0A835P0S1_9PASS|nr:hypothetical protein IHE44_0014882 [Lamprotornis superbus]
MHGICFTKNENPELASEQLHSLIVPARKLNENHRLKEIQKEGGKTTDTLESSYVGKSTDSGWNRNFRDVENVDTKDILGSLLPNFKCFCKKNDAFLTACAGICRKANLTVLGSKHRQNLVFNTNNAYWLNNVPLKNRKREKSGKTMSESSRRKYRDIGDS